MRKGISALLALAGLMLCARPAPAVVEVVNFQVSSESCGSGNNAIDPDEKVTVTVRFANVGPSPTTYAVATLASNANVIPLVNRRVLGSIAPGSASDQKFEFVAKGTCGEAFTVPFRVTDGDDSLCSVNIPLHFGVGTTTTIIGTQPAGIVVPTSGYATPYPSQINVVGITGEVEKVTVTLNDLIHANPDDLDILLVAPDGKKILLMSDAGGTTDANVDLVFVQDTDLALPDAGPLSSGVYLPTNYGPGDVFESPAPAGPYSTDLSTLAGIDPNGTWKLFVMDDAAGSTGSIGSWKLAFRTTNYVCCSETPAPQIVPAGATLTAESCTPESGTVDPNETVSVRFAFRNIGNGTAGAVTSEVVATPYVQPLSGPVATGPLTVADTDYPTHSFIIRSIAGSRVPVSLKLRDGDTKLGTLTYDFDLGRPLPAGANGLEFQNPAGILVPSSGAASPYPSTIYVTNVFGTVNDVDVRLRGITHTYPDNLDILLVGPTGQTLLLMSDAGGGNDVKDATLLFNDDALSSLPDSATITTGSYKPSNYTAGDVLDAPAPPGPYGATLAGFNGISPNGTWRLYVFDDSPLNSGSIDGWDLVIRADSETYKFTAGPKPIPDRNTMESSISVGDHGYVSDVNVGVRLAHPYDADMEMTLVGPDGTEVPLARDRGGSGDNFGTGTNDCDGLPTWFSDEVVNSIADGAAPFSGYFRPESPMTAFDGKPMHGPWTLRIYDDAAGNIGTLGCWKLTITRNASLNVASSQAISIPTEGAASPYPSTISVSGVQGRVVGASVRLDGLTHARPDDLDILLIGPDGQGTILMSDAGGANAVTNLDLVFEEGGDALPNSGLLTYGYYAPVNHITALENEDFPDPVPDTRWPADLGVFRGISPNGTWKLFIHDDSGGVSGSLSGWSLTLHTAEYTGCSGIPYTSADVKWASDLARGAMEATPYSVGRLDIAPTGTSDGRVDLSDVTGLQRKVAGTDPNP